MNKVIIVGAASGIGREIAKFYHSKGCKLGLLDCNFTQLKTFVAEFSGNTIIREINVAVHCEARESLQSLINEMGGVDIFIYSAGITDKTKKWENENKLYQVNAIGFAALTSLVYDYYNMNNRGGHIVGISSVSALHGLKQSIAYCASKSFMKTYMEGLRHDAADKLFPITISEIRPGFVKTPMTENQKNVFWSCTAEHAAKVIVNAIERKKKIVYTGNRWFLIGNILQLLPEIFFSFRFKLKTV